MTAYRSERGTDQAGAIVEAGTVVHNGREFAALGSVIDETHGVIFGYPRLTSGRYELSTWGGEAIAPLTVTGKARGFHGTELTCWAMVYNGRRYHGRNVGTGMFLRMRAGAEVQS